MFARVPITLRMSVLLLTLTENLAAPRLCASTSTSPLAAGAEIAATPTCAAAAIPAPTPPRNAPSHSPVAPQGPKTERPQQEVKWSSSGTDHKPLVSAPIDIYHLELELATHPDRTFVYNLLSTLKEGARIGYTVPCLDRVSPNLISATQHPEEVSLNLQKEIEVLYRKDKPFMEQMTYNFYSLFLFFGQQ